MGELKQAQFRYWLESGGVVRQWAEGGMTDLDPESWPSWQKMVPTRAARIPGPFEVDNGDGVTVYCEDGWLVQGDTGELYALEAGDFDRLYAAMARAA